MKSLFPLFVTDHLGKVKSFYVEYLGFQVVFEAEWYVQLHFERAGQPPLEVAFMKPNLEDQHTSLQSAHSGGGVVLTLEFEDVDAIHEALKHILGPESIVIDLQDEPWGQRHFMFRDPAGILVDAVQSITPAPEYIEAYTQEVF